MSGPLGFQAKRALARSQEMREPVQRSLFGDDVPVRAGDADAEVAQFRSTGYETVRQLLDHLRLPGGHWVEPCAGEGHIVRHVARWCDEHEKPRPSFWTCIELRDDGALWDLACVPEDVTKNLGPEYRGSCGKVWVHSPQDLLTFDERDKGVIVVITKEGPPGPSGSTSTGQIAFCGVLGARGSAARAATRPTDSHTLSPGFTGSAASRAPNKPTLRC